MKSEKSEMFAHDSVAEKIFLRIRSMKLECILFMVETVCVVILTNIILTANVPLLEDKVLIVVT